MVPDDTTRARKISAIIACYKDAQAIPFMAERLQKTFEKIGVDYEIIFVNDGSPDDTPPIVATPSSVRLKTADAAIARPIASSGAGSHGAKRCRTAMSRKIDTLTRIVVSEAEGRWPTIDRTSLKKPALSMWMPRSFGI